MWNSCCYMIHNNLGVHFTIFLIKIDQFIWEKINIWKRIRNKIGCRNLQIHHVENPVFNNLRQVYITSCDGHFLCVYLHTFSCYRHFMYGGHSISRGRRLSVRQDDLLTVDIWHWILKLQRRTQYRPRSLFFILFIKLILWPWMIALKIFIQTRNEHWKKSVRTKCWKITIKCMGK